MNTKPQRTLSDLTQDGLVIGQKIQRIYTIDRFNIRSIRKQHLNLILVLICPSVSNNLSRCID